MGQLSWFCFLCTLSSLLAEQGRCTLTASRGTCIHLGIKIKKENPISFSFPELFTSPVLNVASSAEPLEGSPLNLSCITQLSPYRPHTVLWYLFYGNSTVLQGPVTSSEYQVPAVGLMDTGFYSCEVRTESSNIQKWSPRVPITIKRECLGCWGGAALGFCPAEMCRVAPSMPASPPPLLPS